MNKCLDVKETEKEKQRKRNSDKRKEGKKIIDEKIRHSVKEKI